jgi:hypothetical protein
MSPTERPHLVASASDLAEDAGHLDAPLEASEQSLERIIGVGDEHGVIATMQQERLRSRSSAS